MIIFYRNYINIIIVGLAAIYIAGCAAQTPYLKLDSSLQKDIRTINSYQYIPLDEVCKFYQVSCKTDNFINKAILEKGSGSILLRAGSDRIIVNGRFEKLDRPVILYSGIIFVPVSFIRNNMGSIVSIEPSKPVQEVAPSGKFTITTIVVDAGHGGKDVGATGRRYRLREKDMALKVARKLRNILEDNGIRVIMTRDSDVFISLPRRVEIANRSNADLFVSVHINASRSRSLRGFECYFLSNATDDNARALEALEDASLKISDNATVERSKKLDKTLWDLTLTENRRESADLAGYICKAVERNLTMGNRGIRTARFYVLKHTHMPAVLVEGGYLSNRYDELKLKDPAFLDRLAEAVADGILRYKREYEKTEGFTRS